MFKFVVMMYLVLCACAQAQVVGNPARTARIREACRVEVQAQTMPQAGETGQQYAARRARQNAMFQHCLHREFGF